MWTPRVRDEVEVVERQRHHHPYVGKEAGDEGVDLCRENRSPKQSGRYS